MRKWIIGLVALVLSISVLFALGENQAPAVASGSEQRIADTLELLQASDAVYGGIVESEVGNNAFRQYFLGSTEYLFDAASGRLESVVYDEEGFNAATLHNRSTTVFTDELRRQLALDYVSVILGSDQIGELKITEEYFTNLDYSYTIVEYYNGVETGTNALVFVYPEGAVNCCIMTYGTVFQKTADDRIVFTRGDDFIPEEDAIQTALAFVEPLAQEQNYRVNADAIQSRMSANENDLFYCVEIETLPNKEGETFIIDHTVWVDVYSGEVIFNMYTQ